MSTLLKGLLKTLAAGTMGVLAVPAGFALLNLYTWPATVSANTIAAFLLLPFALAPIVAYAVYRLLELSDK